MRGEHRVPGLEFLFEGSTGMGRAGLRQAVHRPAQCLGDPTRPRRLPAVAADDGQVDLTDHRTGGLQPIYTAAPMMASPLTMPRNLSTRAPWPSGTTVTRKQLSSLFENQPAGHSCSDVGWTR